MTSVAVNVAASPRAWHKLRRRASPVARAAVRFVWAGPAATVALVFTAGCGSTEHRSATSVDEPPAALLAEARPIGTGVRFQPPAIGPIVGPCRPRLGRRQGVHVELLRPTGWCSSPPGSAPGHRDSSRRGGYRPPPATASSSRSTQPGSCSCARDRARCWPTCSARGASRCRPGGLRPSRHRPAARCQCLSTGGGGAARRGRCRCGRTRRSCSRSGRTFHRHHSYTFPPGT